MPCVSLFVDFPSDKLAKHVSKIVFALFSTSNLFFVCENHRTKGAFKVFHSNDLMLLFYSVNLSFILIYEEATTNITVGNLSYKSSFLLDIINRQF